MTTTSSVGSAGRCTRYALALLACGSLFPAIGSALPPAEVQGNTTTAPAVSPLPQASPANSYSLSFKQLGRRDPMYLRGVESTDSADFGIRTDQVVTGVQLVLRFSYSPSMLPELSQLNVLVNDKVAASLPLPKEEAGKDLEKVVEIPARLVTDFNRIDLQLIGHYTMQCEDPLHSSLWARVSNDSQLNIQYSPIALKNDLALLPAPFFDRHDARPLKLPFVFDAAPGPATLFRSPLGELSGNPATGPSVTMMTNPNDPYGKLLVISGRNDSELKTAALAVALGSKALSGRPAGQARRAGRCPAIACLRLQPAGNHHSPAPATGPVRMAQPWRPAPAQVSLHAAAVLDQLGPAGAPQRPPDPLDATAVDTHHIKQGECRDVIVEDMRGQIEPDSTLDLSGLDHYTPMPDLAKFRDSGFPFTRLADLSETAVVMPDANSPEGYPTTGVQVIQARDVETVSDKDLLVLASASDQPLLKLWTDSMPARSESSHHFFDLSDLALRIHDWFSPDSEAVVRKTRSTLAWSGSGTPYLAGFESPLKSGRSVVVIASSEPSRLEEVTAAMIGGDDYKELIQGRLAVIQDKQITSLTADQPYYVGQLGWFRHLQLLLSRHLGWLLFSVLLGFALLCALIFLGLRAQAKRRLS